MSWPLGPQRQALQLLALPMLQAVQPPERRESQAHRLQPAHGNNRTWTCGNIVHLLASACLHAAIRTGAVWGRVE